MMTRAEDAGILVKCAMRILEVVKEDLEYLARDVKVILSFLEELRKKL